MILYFFNIFLIFYGWFFSKLSSNRTFINYYWFFLIFYICLFVGFRYEVGGDWEQYLYHYNVSYAKPLSNFELELTNDFAYLILVKLIVFLNYNVVATNVISAIIVLFCLKHFCEHLKDKYFSLFISYPYFIVIVSMGYNRQSIAAALLLTAITFFLKRKLFYFLIFATLATLFHKTALFIFILLSIFPKNINKFSFILLTILSLLIIFFSYYFVFYDSINRIYFYFIEQPEFESRGTQIRLIFSILAVFLFFAFYKKFDFSNFEKRFYLFFSFIIISLVPISFVFSSFVDRISVYTIFFQISIIPHVGILLKNYFTKINYIMFIVFIYVGYLFIWFNYSEFSNAWLPYQYSFDITTFIPYTYSTLD